MLFVLLYDVNTTDSFFDSLNDQLGIYGFGFLVCEPL
uniref:Uncharacterized protein n=1 Tax=Rhizophora mucronata TaxID=61149 RepID=A0A2P2KUR4_RHIMU